MRKTTQLLFLFVFTILFIFNPLLNMASEISINKQNNNGANTQAGSYDMKVFSEALGQTLNKYINILEANNFTFKNRQELNKEIQKFINENKGRKITDKDIEKFIDVFRAGAPDISADISLLHKKISEGTSVKETEQLQNNLVQGILSMLGLSGGFGGENDNQINSFGGILGGLYEGLIMGPGLGAALGAGLTVAVDASLSVVEIVILAMIGGVVLGAAGFIGGLIGGAILGAIIGAIIGAFIFGAAAAAFFGVAGFIAGLPFFIIGGIILGFIGAVVGLILGIIGGGVVGLIGGGLLGAGMGAIFMGIISSAVGAASGALFGLGLAAAEQLLFIPAIILMAAIGLVIGGLVFPAGDAALAFLGGSSGTSGMSLFSIVDESINANGGKFVNNIEDVTKDVLKFAQKTYGPESFKMINALESVIDTSDLKTPEGINNATLRVLELIPSINTTP